MGQIATTSTEVVLLGINFLINMRLCYKVIQLDRKVSGAKGKCEKDSKKQVLTELILNEFVEVAVPIAFIGGYLILFFGPVTIMNRDRIDNPQSFVMPIVQMALIDSASVLLAGIVLWRSCRINILQEYNEIIKKYWIYLASLGGLSICSVRIFSTCTF